MEIKCKLNNNYLVSSQLSLGRWDSIPQVPRVSVAVAAGNDADKFVKRPESVKNASGLSGLKAKIKNLTADVGSYFKSYKKNVQHTYDHKVVFALVEKELFGRNSIDSLTHDADKMILYLLGFPKSFVSKYHRTHSVHHTESGKNMNLRSMLCDNIASSPEFKPEKKLSLREHFARSKELQSVEGLKEILTKYNFGESLDFDKIKRLQVKSSKGIKGISRIMLKSLLVMFVH